MKNFEIFLIFFRNFWIFFGKSHSQSVWGGDYTQNGQFSEIVLTEKKRNKTETSQVGAPLKAQDAQFQKYAQGVFEQYINQNSN